MRTKVEIEWRILELKKDSKELQGDYIHPDISEMQRDIISGLIVSIDMQINQLKWVLNL